MIKDIYSSGYLVKFTEGDIALLRKAITLDSSIDDNYHVIKQGDSLNSIAFDYYADSKFWFIIADVNGIQNPFEITIGQSLVIPNQSRFNYGRQ